MRWLILIAACIVGYQLFVPPVAGLANQSDFRRTIGKNDYGPEPPEELYAFINLKYAPSTSYRAPGWDQFSSEDLLVRLALLLNKVVSKDGTLDIRVMGFVHAVAFLAAFAWLLYATQGIPAQGVLWILMLLAATDAAYAVYLNSFYAEPASYICCLLLLAESVRICRYRLRPRK